MSMVSVNISISGTVDLADLAKIAALVKPFPEEQASVTLGSGTPSKPTTASKPADKPATSKTEDKPATTTAADTGGQSVDDKRKEATRLLQEINKKNGIEAVRAALGEFGVANISAVADDKLDEVIAAFGDKIA